MFVKHELKMPPSPYGLWHVTTEGDCEGRTTRDLGIHEGWIDEIAEKLSGQCFYTLDFDPVVPETAPVTPVCPSTFISLPIGTGTWDLSSAERVKAFADWLKSHGRKVTVTEGQYYASVGLTFDEERQKEVTVTEGQYYASVGLTFDEERQKESSSSDNLLRATARLRALLGLDK